MPDCVRRKISLAALTVLDATPVEMVRTARRCGYSHVGLRPVPATPEENHVPILDHTANRRELKATLANEGIAVLDCEIVRLTDRIDWDLMAQVVEFSRDFGADRLLVADNDPDPVRSKESLARLAELSAESGVTACLEFMPWTCAPDLRSARELIHGIDGAALLIDAFHLARSGGQPADLLHDDRVSYLQLCDIAGPIPPVDDILREARSNRLFPGEGEVDLAGLLGRYPGLPISLEVPADRLREAGTSAMERAQRAIDLTCALLDSIEADA